MEAVIFLVVIGAIVAAFIVLWIESGKPLNDEELAKVANARRIALLRSRYQFLTSSVEPDLRFKSSMVAGGAFHESDIPLERSAGVIAAYLKHKKHEWVVFAFVREGRVKRLWCNKGPDSRSVAPKIPTDALVRIAVSDRCSAVFTFHNHPNRYGQGVDLLGPSKQDLASCEYLAELFSNAGMDFLDFVCERGDWLVYGHRTAIQASQECGIDAQVASLNKAEPGMRRAARAELRNLDRDWSSRPYREPSGVRRRRRQR